MSNNFQTVNFDNLQWPAEMLIDYVRVWQRPEGRIGCDPADHPTAKYIQDHVEVYNNPNLTTWAGAGYSMPVSRAHQREDHKLTKTEKSSHLVLRLSSILCMQNNDPRSIYRRGTTYRSPTGSAPQAFTTATLGHQFVGVSPLEVSSAPSATATLEGVTGVGVVDAKRASKALRATALIVNLRISEHLPSSFSLGASATRSWQ